MSLSLVGFCAGSVEIMVVAGLRASWTKSDLTLV